VIGGGVSSAFRLFPPHLVLLVAPHARHSLDPVLEALLRFLGPPRQQSPFFFLLPSRWELPSTFFPRIPYSQFSTVIALTTVRRRSFPSAGLAAIPPSKTSRPGFVRVAWSSLSYPVLLGILPNTFVRVQHLSRLSFPLSMTSYARRI